LGVPAREQRAEIRQFSHDAQYLQAHYDELLDRYPERWIAIFEEQVVGTASNLDELLDGLEARRLPIGQVYVHFLTRSDEDLILPS
jgi:hypothetical protein